MIDAEDLELVKRCRAGERDAFERLVEKYQRAIFNLALRMVQSPDDAEDIAQTAFLKAYERLETYKEKHKFFSWLYRIAVNESLSFLEERKRFSGLDEASQIPEPEKADTAEASDLSARIEEALMELKVEYRAVTVLKHFEGLSYEEIGQILDIPEKKVKSRLFTARQMLRDILVRKGLGRND
jgi:RNA polymerase sigma-70 factor (ECF subfamily)